MKTQRLTLKDANKIEVTQKQVINELQELLEGMEFGSKYPDGTIDEEDALSIACLKEALRAVKEHYANN